MKNKIKINFRDKRTIILSILLGLLLIGLIIFICGKVFHKDKEITPDDPTTKEFENYLKDAIKPFDEDTIKDFISSTDNLVTVDEFYWGALYTNDISDEIKVLYTLSRMFYKDSNLINYMTGAKMFDDSGYGNIELSIKFINKALNAKFKDTKIEKNATLTDGFFNGINMVVCDEDNCMISISKNNTTGASSDGVYTTKNASLEKVSNGYTYTAEYYYYIMQLTGEMKFGVYKNAFKEETYCETSLVDLYLTNNKLPEGCQNGVNYPKIRYNFDKNYRFINSEIL